MKRPSTLCALTLLALTSVTRAAVAGAQEARAKEPTSLKSSSVQVELKKAGSVEFLATGWPSALRINGKGVGPEGSLSMTGSEVSGSLAVDLGTLTTGIALRDRHMKEQYLEVQRFPRAELALTRLDLKQVPDGSDFGAVTVPFEGTLSLHGVQKPVSGQAKVSRSAEKVTVNAVFSIQLGDFGIAVPKYLGITVAEKVEVKAAFSALLEHGRDVAGR